MDRTIFYVFLPFRAEGPAILLSCILYQFTSVWTLPELLHAKVEPQNMWAIYVPSPDSDRCGIDICRSGDPGCPVNFGCFRTIGTGSGSIPCHQSGPGFTETIGGLRVEGQLGASKVLLAEGVSEFLPDNPCSDPTLKLLDFRTRCVSSTIDSSPQTGLDIIEYCLVNATLRATRPTNGSQGT